MVKQRFTALDVRASVEELQHSLVGLRLLNLYDINSHMFIFKFGHGENKKSVLLENGVRIHLSDFAREKPKIPSQFTLKVRKHVRAWRLDSISQLQHDRTIDMCFGVKNNNHAEGGDDGGSHCFHIIIELFRKET
ncbi:Fibronectin-binding protein A N-terminus (FbpA), putative [Angomonas deanei]|uniref:Fibronectin-binding protein A N-terminus (FbpA), putative n=1 Tax=Angomonas deanei TaxID=59799 RepID=A0A7G2CLU3_9TRYP|nr:Fibronectin-binding protein A N-terminus (FbpA), putative [Angomonas deanei]